MIIPHSPSRFTLKLPVLATFSICYTRRYTSLNHQHHEQPYQESKRRDGHFLGCPCSLRWRCKLKLRPMWMYVDGCGCSLAAVHRSCLCLTDGSRYFHFHTFITLTLTNHINPHRQRSLLTKSTPSSLPPATKSKDSTPSSSPTTFPTLSPSRPSSPLPEVQEAEEELLQEELQAVMPRKKRRKRKSRRRLVWRMPLICLEEMKEEIIKSILSTSNKSIKCTLVVLVQLFVFYVLFLSAYNSYHWLVHHVQIPVVWMYHDS